ncbi:MAG: type II toxin-antitoxin system HicA family toxin [Thaumarchaeota archaeon]|nr:type II toxin-antitoxin system HicA family toxin [Nitrososphaerota archaeon]
MSKTTKLPSISWRDVIKALKKKGYHPTDQSGSHIVLRHIDGRRITIPRHDPIGKGLLMEIIAEAESLVKSF